METIIKVSPSELDIKLLNKIRDFIGNRDIDVTITLKEIDRHFAESLNRSVKQADDESSLVTFTMESFMAYLPKSSE
jgi:hypothetical protein